MVIQRGGPEQLSRESRARIQSLRKAGKKSKTIARMLNCSLRTVDRWVHAVQIIDNKKRKRVVGRKPILTGKLAKDVDKLLEDRVYLGSRRIAPIINKKYKADISARTIRRFQNNQGFTYGKDTPKPTLTDKMKKNRLEWAKRHLKDDFRRYIFSDSKIFRIGTPGLRHRRRGPAKIIQRDKWGGQVHVWWAFSYDRIYPPQEIKGTLDADGYVKILKKTLGKHYDNGNLFIQDKARCNISKKASKWLDDHHIDYFKDWPTKGIDMNVIENVWGTLEQEKRAKDFSKVDPMKKIIISKMKFFSILAVRRYIDSMPLRLQEVIDKKGSYTKYF